TRWEGPTQGGRRPALPHGAVGDQQAIEAKYPASMPTTGSSGRRDKDHVFRRSTMLLAVCPMSRWRVVPPAGSGTRPLLLAWPATNGPPINEDDVEADR